ncbi:MAG: GAF domain-containing protein [Anaerolineae bacterium]|nr:GAF domain-containing protein [Anaerolineae bacterium]
MNKLFRYLFVVQYDYRDSAQAMRARVLLPLSSSIAILVLIFGLYATTVTMFGIDVGMMDNKLMGGIAAPVLIIWSVSAMWLTQHGRSDTAAWLIGVLLGLTALISVLTDGLAASPVLTIPILLTYVGLAYGSRGMAIALLSSWAMLIVTAYAQSEDLLQLEPAPFDELLTEALVSAGMLTIISLMLWVFSWNLQRALLRANRAVTQTRAIAETGQAISRILNVDELLSSAVDLIRDRFALYHVQIFMIDDAHDYANLAVSTGEAGRALLTQGFRVPVDPGTVVGEAIVSGQLLYVPDITRVAFRNAEPLANARSELAIPLLAGEDSIGVLDIHSLRPNAFSSQDVEVMRVMANQISQAIQNARLFETQQRSMLQNRQLFLESESNLREIERLNRELAEQAWQDYIQANDADLGLTLVGQDIQPEPTDWTPAMREAATQRHVVSRHQGNQQTLAVPINVHGQSIGVIEVCLADAHSQREALNILQAVAERMSVSLENARLVEQARSAVAREQQINAITARLQGLTTIQDVLTTALDALGQTLGADQGAIRLLPFDKVMTPELRSPAGNGQDEGGPTDRS